MPLPKTLSQTVIPTRDSPPNRYAYLRLSAKPNADLRLSAKLLCLPETLRQTIMPARNSLPNRYAYLRLSAKPLCLHETLQQSFCLSEALC